MTLCLTITACLNLPMILTMFRLKIISWLGNVQSISLSLYHLKLKDKGSGLVKCPSRNALTVTTHLVAILLGAVRWLTHLITYLLLTTSYPRFLMTMSPELHLS